MMRGDMLAIIAPKGTGVKLFNAARHREPYSPLGQSMVRGQDGHTYSRY